jgi:hypothetical protein
LIKITAYKARRDIRDTKPPIDKLWFYQTIYVKLLVIFQGIRYNESMTNSPDEEIKIVIRENTIEARPWHMATEKKVDKEEFDRRMAICETCEFLKKPAKQCSKCGCFMKLKTKIDRAHCPIHKW